MELYLTLHFIGSLLAVGMIIGDILSTSIEDIKSALGFEDTLKAFGFYLIMGLLLIIVSFIFSWIAVGFIYMRSKEQQ